jgi:hypothetical protein
MLRRQHLHTSHNSFCQGHLRLTYVFQTCCNMLQIAHWGERDAALVLLNVLPLACSSHCTTLTPRGRLRFTIKL